MNIFNAYTSQKLNHQTAVEDKMNAKEFLGKEVLEDRGWKIGKVRDVIIDTNTWEVKGFDVALERQVAEEYGMKKVFGSSTVPIRVEDIKSVADAIMLKGSKLSLATMPEVGPMESNEEGVSTKDKIKQKF